MGDMMPQSGIYAGAPCCYVPAGCLRASNNQVISLEGRVLLGWRSQFLKFRFEPWWAVPIRVAWCWVLLLVVRTFLGQEIWCGEVSWEDKVGSSGQVWIPEVFGGPFLQPRPSLIAEENHWQCGCWSSGSTGCTAGSDIAWTCHGWQGSRSVPVHSWDQR